ncbi:MAG: 50S ribosomal protein L25 [Patescibacteria group bacterium]|jgi:large subunit ribosomal protein L25
MAEFSIQAQLREEKGRKTDALRAEHLIPAVVYGFGTEPLSITVAENDLKKLYTQAGESTVIDLNVNGKVLPVLLHDLQYDPLTNFMSHVDFRCLDLTKKIEANISIRLTGEAPAVKELGGTLVQSLEEVEVLALPSALIREFVVDVSGLKTYDDVIRVKDLAPVEGIEILTQAENAIALVQEPRAEEEFAPTTPAEGEAVLPEIISETEKAKAEAEAAAAEEKKS